MSYFYTIKYAQIDPNGLCNSKCWFCPVAYVPNPEPAKKNMDLNLLESILKQLYEAKGTIVDKNFDLIYTAHYNEVLLYKYFEEMLILFRKYKFKTIILTNGIAFTKSKIDIINNYADVVLGVCLNIPSSNAKKWSDLTGSNESIFNKIVENVKYAINTFGKRIDISVQINTIDDNTSFTKTLENAPSIHNKTYIDEINEMRTLFPEISSYANTSLVDRAGYLDSLNIITNKEYVQNISEGKRVVGCSNGIDGHGRPNEWIHINAIGQMFICCNDYDFDTVYGDLNEKSLSEIWMSLEHKKMILNSYKTLCTTCSAAIWG